MDKEKVISVGSMLVTVVVMVAVGIYIFSAMATQYEKYEQRLAELEDYKDQWGGQPQWRTVELEQQAREEEAAKRKVIAQGLLVAFLVVWVGASWLREEAI